MLLLSIYGVFRTSRVQTWMAQKTAKYLSEELGTTVQVGGLDISWFLDIELQNIRITDKHYRNIIKARSLRLDLGKLNRKNRFIGIYAISLHQGEINLVRQAADSAMNYSFIVDYFSPHDTTPADTTLKPWKLGISGIRLKDCSFSYNDELYQPISDGVDYNHLNIYDLNLDIRKLAIAGDSITARLKTLSLKEKSGFVLTDLSAVFSVKPTQISANNLHILTPASHIQMNLSFSHSGFNAYNSFIDSVKMTGDFRETTLNLNDISYFAPEIKGMDNEIKIAGLVKGTVASLKSKNLQLALGKQTIFEGNVNMDGLPDITETFIHLKVKKFKTDYYDLANFKLPGYKNLEIPEAAKNAGIIGVTGYFTGFINDFVSSADFKTGLGTLKTDLSLKTISKNNIAYDGHLSLIDWDLGKTFPESGKLGLVDFSSSINGIIIDYKDINLYLKANVSKIELLGNEFNGITIDGKLENRKFNGNLNLNDDLIKLDFLGLVDFSDSLPRFNFKSKVTNAYLHRLNLWDRDSTSCLSSTMDFDFKGSNIDNLTGTLRFDSTTYVEKSKKYELKELLLSTNKSANENKTLQLKSDFLDAVINGKYTFLGFYSSLNNIINTYLPSVQFADKAERHVEIEQLFDYEINIKNITPLTELFLPQFKLLTNANLFGSYNSTTSTILLNGEASQFRYEGMLISDWYIRGQNTGRSMSINTGAQSILLKEPTAEDPAKLGIENFSIDTYMQGDSIRYQFTWQNQDSILKNRGDISGQFLFAGFPVIRSNLSNVDVVINNLPWMAHQEGDILIDSTSVAINNLIISGNKQKLRINGKISEDPTDIFSLYFDNLDISNADMLIRNDDLNFDGFLSGNISLNDFYNARTIQSDISINNLAFNEEKMGDAHLLSRWDNEKSGLEIDGKIIYKGNIGTHNPITVKGYIYTGKKLKNNFDLDIGLTNYKLASLNPFLQGFASNLKGMATGNIKLDGSFSEPSFTGSIQLLRTQMKIDYLNVTYSFADQVTIAPDLISARNITIYDSLGNTGKCDFRLTHQYFSNMLLDITVNANNLAGLNTTLKNNELFYGNAFATGTVKIKGPFSDIKMDINVKSEPNTNIVIPINLSVDATENEYIRFVNKAEPDILQKTFEANTSGVNLNMILDVTKDAGIQIFLPEDIGNIKANGSGNIQMGIDTRGDITMFGDYRMNEGTFLFTLRNVLNRVFSIEPGSLISFKGSPYDADINLKAVYKLKASLKGIPELANNPDYAGKSEAVDCIISLNNNLYNPDIGFSIRLPEADQRLRQMVFSAIDTTNNVVMTQQMVSLLMLKSFSFSSENTSLASTVGSSSIEMLTNQLGNMLSQISKDIDIGLNYRTADALSSEELELALSTHLFNDRVTIDGNLGVTTTGSTQNTSNIVGDVNIDVKITPDGRFRVKAFNKANNPYDISSSVSTYKQGIGVYYRYEFDKFSEIFRKQRKKQIPPM